MYINYYRDPQNPNHYRITNGSLEEAKSLAEVIIGELGVSKVFRYSNEREYLRACVGITGQRTQPYCEQPYVTVTLNPEHIYITHNPTGDKTDLFGSSMVSYAIYY